MIMPHLHRKKDERNVNFEWIVLEHLPHIHDFAWSEVHIFLNLKRFFSINTSIQKPLRRGKFYFTGINRLICRWDKFSSAANDYI